MPIGCIGSLAVFNSFVHVMVTTGTPQFDILDVNMRFLHKQIGFSTVLHKFPKRIAHFGVLRRVCSSLAHLGISVNAM